jgi:hypothetical protein
MSTGSSPSRPNPGAPKNQQGKRPSESEATLQPSLADDPAELARNLASQATSAAQSLSSDLQQAVKATTRAVKAQASEFGADVGHELSQVAEAQKIRGVEAMQGFARAVDSAAAGLAEQSPMVARYVRDAAKQVDGFSNNIRGRSVTELMHAATDLARSQPVLFFAGALAAGFALSRFLKSSSPESESMSSDSGSMTGTGTRNSTGTGSMGAGGTRPTGTSGSSGQGSQRTQGGSPGSASGSGPRGSF